MGSLNHLAITSRLDIAFAFSKLSQFNSMRANTHFKVAKRVSRYVIHPQHFSLKYGGERRDHKHQIVGYADAEYGSNLINRKSTMGYVFVFKTFQFSRDIHPPTPYRLCCPSNPS
jgi:hypothetical protein